MKVYEINLDYLIYNKYNGRIASLVKSHEQQIGTELDPIDDSPTIEKFLWKSNTRRNETTKKDIKEKGQLQYGIVTKDGVIINGNRRAMLLKRLKMPYFRAVILEEALTDNSKEIMHLETTYQMGEDPKLDYNPIEKYLKCDDLIKVGFSNEEIAEMMGEKPNKIDEYLSIMKLMEDYLNNLGYYGIYTRLDKTEGAFVDVNSYLKQYEGNRSRTVEWNYGDTDINDLKLIYFDYIRGIYNRKESSGSGNSKDYRFIGQTSKKDSFFANKDVWDNFCGRHFEKIDPIRKNEKTIDCIKEHSTQGLDDLLKNRDENWADEVDPHLKKNMGLGREELDNLSKQNEPMDLLLSAEKKLKAINPESNAFLKNYDVYEKVDHLRKLTEKFKTILDKYRKHNKTI